MNTLIRLVRRAAAAALIVPLMLAGNMGAASAQELAPEHLQLARRYVDLTDSADIYARSLVQAGMQSLNVIVQRKPSLDIEARGAISLVIQSYVDRKSELMDQFARVYAVRFSMEELEQIVAFYESPVGRKLAESNPDINADLQRVMQVFEINLQTEFFAAVRANLREKGLEF